ncbi:hypothetical protein ACSMX9_15090 [Streptomyces sp. LE64]|uniref:hypothetical protein n=1 Tax=Streptomyces sp. LE64 TaxID=3448653 RepID=UPI004041312A
MLTINVAVLLAVVIVLRLRRRTQARSRLDEKLTVIVVLVFGVSGPVPEWWTPLSPAPAGAG